MGVPSGSRDHGALLADVVHFAAHPRQRAAHAACQHAGPQRIVRRFRWHALCSATRNYTWTTAFTGARVAQTAARFNLSAFVITETELKLIAAAAIIGLRSQPKNG